MQLIVLLLSLWVFESQEKKTISFESADGITITADLYMTHDKTAPLIVLFHQARWSRGEYEEIAPRLNLLGYNCMAVDLRSGGEVNGVVNQTTISAEKAMKETRYIDSYPDIDAAVKYAKQYFAEGKLIIWGSSYSSALALRYAGEHTDLIDAVLSFSPGEYFKSQGKTATYITEGAAKITAPVFITSAKGEKAGWWKIYEAIPSESKYYFLPETAGNHGSRALWSKFGDSLRYWDAVEKFLETIE
ncbi:MAG: alpha/beta fold hydrolase [Bacteroidota bacterium]